MANLTFQIDKCKGCGLCVDVCPKNVLALAKDKINAKEITELRTSSFFLFFHFNLLTYVLIIVDIERIIIHAKIM